MVTIIVYQGQIQRWNVANNSKRELVVGIGYVIRLIPSRYEEEYIDRSTEDCARCSFIYRLPSANIPYRVRDAEITLQ
ncbi:hypothetical protein PUN28_010956 [Cardiocondyla obscurior]|uniref:Uncharacterized protein n=1 Tax=Cardiocondyla obscurior TaxID=286306 RepID=A0AAW2FKS5_9HYME